MRIGIVGAGITGMTAAALLARRGHQVTLLEARPQLGGLARSLQFGPHQFCPGPQYIWGWDEAAGIRAALGLELPARAMHPAFEQYAVADADWGQITSGVPDAVHADVAAQPGAQELVGVLDRLGRASRAISRNAGFRLSGFQMLSAVLRSPELTLREKAEVVRWRNASVAQLAARFSVCGPTLRALTYAQSIFAERLDRLSVMLFAAGRHHLKGPLFIPDGGVVGFIQKLSHAVHAAQVEVRLSTPVTAIDQTTTGHRLTTPRESVEVDHLLWCCSPGVVGKFLPAVGGRFEAGNSIGCLCIDAQLGAELCERLRDKNFNWYADHHDLEFAAPREELRAVSFTSPTLNAGTGGLRQVICVFFPGGPSLASAVLSRVQQLLAPWGSFKVHDLLCFGARAWTDEFGAFNGAVYGRRMTSASMRRTLIARLPPRMSLAHSGAGIPGVLGCLQMAEAAISEIPVI
jgi:phytoene dehydrogenase-like protein